MVEPGLTMQGPILDITQGRPPTAPMDHLRFVQPIDGLPSGALSREIQRLGYVGGERTIRSYVSGLLPQVAPEPVARLETHPDHELHVDWYVFRRGKHPCQPSSPRWDSAVIAMWNSSLPNSLTNSSNAILMLSSTLATYRWRFSLTT